MDQSSSSDSAVLPGTAVLVLCAIILLAGYAVVAARPLVSGAFAAVES